MKRSIRGRSTWRWAPWGRLSSRARRARHARRAQPHTLGSLSFPRPRQLSLSGRRSSVSSSGLSPAWSGTDWRRCPCRTPSWVTVLVLAVAVVGFAIWNAWLRPVAVQVARGERDVAVQVFGLGTVEARVTSQVGFKVAGVLVDLRADVGDRVAKGAVLARLDDREQQRAGRPRQGGGRTGRKPTCKKPRPASRRPRRTTPMPRASMNAGKSWLQSNTASVETAQTAKAAQRCGAGRSRPGQQRCRWWPRPPSTTPRRKQQLQTVDAWIFTRCRAL